MLGTKKQPGAQADEAGAKPFGVRDLIVLLSLCVPTLFVCVLVAWRLWNIGIPSEWTWPYFETPGKVLNARGAIALSALLILALYLCVRRGLPQKADEVIAVFLCMVLTYGIIRQMGNSGPFGKEQPMAVAAVPWKGGYYGEAVRVDDMTTYLDAYAETISELRVNYKVRGHIADHPVGPVLFHWLVNRTLEKMPKLARKFVPEDAAIAVRLHSETERLANLQDRVITTGPHAKPKYLIGPPDVLVPLSAGAFAGIWASALLLRAAFWLSLIPIYLLGRELYSKEVGLVALTLSALIPSLHLFSPYVDQAFILFGAYAFYAWHRAARTRSWPWAAVSGAILFLGLLWSLSLLLMVAVLGVGTLLMVWREFAAGEGGINWRGWGRVALGGFGAFGVLSLLPMLLFDYDTWSVWKICLSQHATFSETFNRTCLPWLLFNPVEFLLFTGVAISTLMLVAAVTDLRGWWRERRRAALSLLPWTILAVLAAANLSGKNLGEVGRLWMFLMPFAALSAAPVLVRLDRRRGYLVACVVAVTAAQLIAFRLTLNVFSL